MQSMDGLINPVGHESARTYWVRRLLVLVALLLVIALIVAVIKAIAAPPKSDPVAAPVSSQTATPTPSATTSTPIASAPATSASSAEPKPSVTPTPSPKPAAPKPAATPTPTPLPKCDPAKLHVAVTGPTVVDRDDAAAISVGITNALPVECALSTKTFELRIYSGTDRIWSTLDCPAGVPDKAVRLGPAKAQQWKFSWPTKRSAAGCKLVDNLRPGTYVATAVVEGAKPAQHVMRLR